MIALAWQRLEGALILLSALLIAWHASGPLPWWLAVLVFFAPDLSFAAYTAGPRIGALVYNAVHLYAFGAVLLAIGLVSAAPLLTLTGALWLGHSGFDRMLGYGLKSPEAFSLTHLGRIGKAR